MKNAMTKLVPAATALVTGAVATAAAPDQKAKEAELLAVLKKADATRKQKADACRELGVYGSKEAVAVVAPLLCDPEMSHMARYALEPNPDPSVDEALCAALGKVQGKLKAGVIGSIRVRKDAKAVPALIECLKDSDPDVAQAAARALGCIGTKEAVDGIRGAIRDTAPGNRTAFREGMLRAAEAMARCGDKAGALAIYERMSTSQWSPEYVKTGAAAAAKALK